MATGFQSSVFKASDMVVDYCCKPCEEENIIKDADVYCDKCKTFYCGSCRNMHIQLYKTHKTYEKNEIQHWPLAKAKMDLLEKCLLHQDKKLKQLCEDHDLLCCNTCITINHRKCGKVSLITDFVQSQSPVDFRQLMTDIKTTLDQLMMLQHSREADIKSLEESYQTSLQEMNRVRKKINAALDELEMATFMHLGEAVTSLKEKLKTELEKCTDMYETAESFRNAVCDIGDKKNELIFLAHKKWLDKKRQLNSFLKQKRSQAYACSVSFQGSIDIERYLSTLSCLGKVLYEKQSDSDHALTVIDKKECIVNCGDDTNVRCGITGICCISDGQIIITDWNNKNVKLVDRQYKIISQYDVSSYVFDVCRTAPFEVAVTVEDNKNTHEVQFISVHEGTLVIQRKFKVQHACIGIAHHHGELYVTSRDALYKYSSSGERLSKLYEDTSTYGAVFKCAVNQTGEIIYVTSYSRCALLAIDKDGTVLSIFIDPELAQPWNVYVTAHGHVLVCGRNSNTVIQVDSRARRKISTLLRHTDGVHLPLSVGFTKETGSLIVGQWDNNKLLICTTN